MIGITRPNRKPNFILASPPNSETGRLLKTWLRTLETANTNGVTDRGPTLENCIERYLDSRKSEWGPGSLVIIQVLLKRLKDFAHQHNKQFIQELTVDL